MKRPYKNVKILLEMTNLLFRHFPDLLKGLEYCEICNRKTECPKGVRSARYAIHMFYYCKHCGAQLEGFFEVASYDHSFVQRNSEIERQQKYNAKAGAYEDVREKAEKRMENLKSCPICGGAIDRNPGYYIPRLEFSTSCFGNESNEKHLKYKLEQMENQRKQVETESAQKQVEDFIICNNPPAAVVSSPAGPIKDSPEQLRNYILTLLRLENNVYSLQQRLSSLYYQRIVNDRNVNYEIYAYLKAKLT